MNKTIIREVKLEDFDDIFPLFKQMQLQKPLNKQKAKSFFNEMLSSDKHFGWIAIFDKKIVGYMDVVLRTYHFAFEFVARIETTIVDEKFRRMGIATKLIKKCEKKAKRLGYKIIELDSTTHRIPAHKFYMKHGYSKRGFTFWKRL